jgi:ubiquinone/menaquinone biosynthesis C-methylase UbiE
VVFVIQNTMPIRLDPEGNEPATLFDFAGSFTGQRVLEIGCGDGCLTWLYAGLACFV